MRKTQENIFELHYGCFENLLLTQVKWLFGTKSKEGKEIHKRREKEHTYKIYFGSLHKVDNFIFF
jgi:hypothetical protein